ncbi:outer membrane protein assembly factor BamB [Gammaproteobacteria bacterium AB-CW1]|uniref:Outer membrane protein assembly factor BamB n=1 Tax=Natronospira elongata TaxID=3110268 RepID=A0AAP6MK94_9GAMM|nr:outer membrane protein assembly factor BamB [Gammaproteobacteria bacterium AB-CW1]
MPSLFSRTTKRIALLLIATAALAACAQQSAIEEPRDLERFEARYDVERLWSARAGGSEERLFLGLRPASDGERVYIAGHNGRVQAVNAETGRRIWQVDLDAPLAGGPSLAEGRLIVGSLDGRVFSLRTEDGDVRWRERVNGEIVTPPAVARGYVVVKSGNGYVHGLSLSDGGELWSRSEEVPPLKMRGNTSPIIRGSRVLVGFDNGQVRAYGVRDGQNQWSQMVGISAGRNELEQIADIAPFMAASDDTVYAVSASDRMAAVSLSGSQRWERDIGSLAGLDIDDDLVYVTDRHSEVHGLNRRDGTSVWLQDAMRARQMTAPVVYQDTVAVADLEGYVHFLSADGGELVARERMSRNRINMAPLAVGDKLIVQDGEGRVRAYRLKARD